MATPNPATDTVDWWNNLIDLHPPKNQVVTDTMDAVRKEFKILGWFLLEELPPGLDLTVALRSLKDACQLAVAAVACDQGYYEDDE